MEKEKEIITGGEANKDNVKELVEKTMNDLASDPILMRRALLNGLLEVLENEQQILALVDKINTMWSAATTDKICEYLSAFSKNAQKQEKSLKS